VTKLKEENRPLFEYGNISHGSPKNKFTMATIKHKIFLVASFRSKGLWNFRREKPKFSNGCLQQPRL
jgi:hypothetical protein